MHFLNHFFLLYSNWEFAKSMVLVSTSLTYSIDLLFARSYHRKKEALCHTDNLWYWLCVHLYCIVGRTHCWRVMKYLVSHSIEHPKNVAKADFLICGIKAYNRPNSTNHISLTIHTSRKHFEIRWIACSKSFIMIIPPLRASSISISSIRTLKSQ
jgi:hypothetical protein